MLWTVVTTMSVRIALMKTSPRGSARGFTSRWRYVTNDVIMTLKTKRMTSSHASTSAVMTSRIDEWRMAVSEGEGRSAFHLKNEWKCGVSSDVRLLWYSIVQLNSIQLVASRFPKDNDFNPAKFYMVKGKCITREGKLCTYDVTCAQMTSHQNGGCCWSEQVEVIQKVRFSAIWPVHSKLNIVSW